MEPGRASILDESNKAPASWADSVLESRIEIDPIYNRNQSNSDAVETSRNAKSHTCDTITICL